MKLLPALGLTAAGLFALSQLSVAGIASRLTYQLSNVVPSLSGIQPIIKFNLLIQNPSSGSFNIAALVANLYLNGQQIGNVYGFTPVTIPPTGQVNMPLNATINAGLLITDIVNMISGSAGATVTVELKGTINANGVLLPVDVSYAI